MQLRRVLLRRRALLLPAPPPAPAPPALRRALATTALRDAAARALVNRAIDSFGSEPAAPPRAPQPSLSAAFFFERGSAASASAPAPASTPEEVVDVLTWRRIVDRPVVADADCLGTRDLYPPRAPRLADLAPLGPAMAAAGAAAAAAAAASASASTAAASEGPFSGLSFAGLFGGGRPSNAAAVAPAPHRTDAFSPANSTVAPSALAAPAFLVADAVDNESWDHLDLTRFPDATASYDPFELIGPELRGINGNIKQIIGIDHPVLATVAKYFFDFGGGGKKIRPALVLLMAHAVNAHESQRAGVPYASSGTDELSPRELAAAQELAAQGVPALLREGLRLPLPAQVALPLQRRLAEITEMIHTASLLHDDVIDAADTRRGVSSVNTIFGNKLAVLAGDFLLARASVCLARLRSVPVVELLSTVIEHLVKGEVMQMKTALRSEAASQAAFDLYLRKSYYKTGSLMANSCKAIAMLGCYPDIVCTAAFKYGMHLGIAFQLIDDLLDFEGTALSLGKPALNDVRQGLATAPVLFAAHRFPTLLPLIERKFATPGDVEFTVRMVAAADGLVLTRRLAMAHAQVALDSIADLSDSPARTSLAALVRFVVSRTR